MSFILEKPEIIPGLLFFGCIIYYGVILFELFAHGAVFATPNKIVQRRALYLALGRKRTLRGMNWRTLAIVKKVARTFINGLMVFIGIVLFLPAAHILIFENESLMAAIDAIFDSSPTGIPTR